VIQQKQKKKKKKKKKQKNETTTKADIQHLGFHTKSFRFISSCSL